MNYPNLPKYINVLLIFTVANLAILATRNSIVGTVTFDFLKSNLWSGIVPFIIALVLQVADKHINKFFFIIGSLLWVLFYPNAPYMISDLIHVYEEPKDLVLKELIVHDTLIVFSIALLSVFYGFISVKIMFNLFLKRFGSVRAHSAIAFSLLLSCVGFYMGRELVSVIKIGNGYLYSSEIFSEPVYIIKTVWHALVPIHEHKSAYYMMGLFGFVQLQLLMMMRDVNDIEDGKNNNT